MFGVMDNNMGFHKERSYVRPQTTHPEIKTDGSMFDFSFSLLNSLCNRSIFVLIHGLVSTISNFVNNMVSNITISNNVLNSYTNTSNLFSNFSIFVQLTINLIINLLNTVLFTLSNFNFVNTLTNFVNHLSFVFSYNFLISLNDINLSLFETSLQYFSSL